MAYLIFDQVVVLPQFRGLIEQKKDFITPPLASSANNRQFDQALFFKFRLHDPEFDIYIRESVGIECFAETLDLLKKLKFQITIQKANNGKPQLIFNQILSHQPFAHLISDTPSGYASKIKPSGKLSITKDEFLALNGGEDLTIHISAHYDGTLKPFALPPLDCLELKNETKFPPILPLLFQYEKFPDLTLIVGPKDGEEGDANNNVQQQVFRVQKAILAAQSPVFEAMFQQNPAGSGDTFKESQESRVEIADTDPAIFNHLLKYIYTGRVDLHRSFVLELFIAADKYQVTTLKDYCEEYLCENFYQMAEDEVDLFHIEQVAEMHGAHKLKTLALAAIFRKAKQGLQEMKNQPKALVEASRVVFNAVRKYN